MVVRVDGTKQWAGLGGGGCSDRNREEDPLPGRLNGLLSVSVSHCSKQAHHLVDLAKAGGVEAGVAGGADDGVGAADRRRELAAAGGSGRGWRRGGERSAVGGRWSVCRRRF